MAVLHLVSLQCNETEDTWGEDECELRVFADGRIILLRQDMNNGDTWSIDEKIPFKNRTKIQLWDLDAPGWSDDHDWLGSIVVRAVPTELIEGTFNQDGADYVLSYQVLNE